MLSLTNYEVKIENVSVSSSEVMCSLSHETKVVGIYRYLIGDATKSEEDLVLNKKTISASNFKSVADEKFVVIEKLSTFVVKTNL